MSLRILAIASALCVAAYASVSDDWNEEQTKIPLVKPTALLDQSLSRVVPGAKRGSLAEQEHSAGLEIELSAVKSHVDLTKSDDTLRLAFTAFNPTDADIKICTRDTPLAGNPGKLLADLFVVQNQAAMVMPYRGKDMKMTEQPGPEEYITIPAGKAVTDVISLKAYKLAADGTYYIPSSNQRTHTSYTRTSCALRWKWRLPVWRPSKHVTQSARWHVGQRDNKYLPKLQLVHFHSMDVAPPSKLLWRNGTKMLFTRLHQQEPVLRHHAKLKSMLGSELQPLRANSWQEQLRNLTPWPAWRAIPSTSVNQATPT